MHHTMMFTVNRSHKEFLQKNVNALVGKLPWVYFPHSWMQWQYYQYWQDRVFFLIVNKSYIAYQMCTKLKLRKSSINAQFPTVWVKSTQNYLKILWNFLNVFKEHIFSKNQWASGWVVTERVGTSEVLSDGLTHGWFRSFHGICWQ